MRNHITSVEVKCECRIPFHDELRSYFTHLLETPQEFATASSNGIKHLKEINDALHMKILLVAVDHDTPLLGWRDRTSQAVESTLHKSLLGTISSDARHTTLILI